jgi:hypothetical protein
MFFYTYDDYFITDRCCYYYSIVPINVTTISCNPQGMSIDWLCQILAPPNDYTNLSVQWYKAAPGTADNNITAEGELLSELSGKYSFTITGQLLADNQSALNGLFSGEFGLTIHNFNSSTDDGYYWCQIVANGSCPLEPSPIGYLPWLSTNSLLRNVRTTYSIKFSLIL